MTGKQQVKNAVKELIAKGNTLFPRGKINYNELDIRFSLYGSSRVGYANWYKRRLSFHKILAETNTKEYIKDTVIHEVSHLFQKNIYPYSKPHGREFQRICKALGGNGNRTSNQNTKGMGRMKRRYIYTCPRCGKEIKLTTYKHNEEQRGTSCYLCKTCRVKIKYTNTYFEFR